MSEIYTNLCVFLLFISAVLSEKCSPCQCDNLKITCSDSFRQISSFSVINFPEAVKWVDLEITNQKLSILPDNIFQNKGLTTLGDISIKHCELHTIHEDAFNNVTDLVRLDLSHNSLSKLPDYLFKPIEKVQYLILQNNKLETINDVIFANLTDLINLDISNNLLSHFSKNALLNNKNIRQLLLNNNKLKSLNINTIEKNEDLNVLKISNNPWTCDCLIRDLFVYMLQKYKENISTYKPELSNTKCSAPDNLIGLSWRDQKVNQKKFNCHLNAVIKQIDVKAEYGAKVKLKCKVESTTVPRNMWQFNNQNIYINTSKYSLTQSQINQINYWYNLEISDLTEADGGTYYCKLIDHEIDQSSEAKVKLIILDAPINVISIVIIVGLVLFVGCLVIILFKCTIKLHINRHTKEDQPNFQENFQEADDDSSVRSLKIDIKCN